jgi:NAD(P)-dependent dehydrogenase (short-subunit alcohol dehydrogenase family)
VLTLRGAHVITAARTLDKAQAACASVKGATTPVACELASVRAVVAKIKSLRVPIDGIICNAGIMALPRLNQAYGYELQFFTNHIGHYSGDWIARRPGRRCPSNDAEQQIA